MTAPHPEPSETVRERPILFSGAMVSALLDGSKTQTRRVMKPQPPEEAGSLDVGAYHPTIIVRGEEEPGAETFGASTWDGEWAAKCPYGQPGDRLIVKEAAWMWCERRPNGTTPTGRAKWLYVPLESAPVRYVTDSPARPTVAVVSPDTGNVWGWRMKVARFLPRWASRLTLELTGVRVERVQDISEADAKAEGVERASDPDDITADDGALNAECGYFPPRSYVDGYRLLWDSLNASRGYGWDVNPWVWVIEFRVCLAALAAVESSHA